MKGTRTFRAASLGLYTRGGRSFRLLRNRGTIKDVRAPKSESPQ
jgi:hypothetical protein